MTEHPHITEGDIECSCNPLVLTVEPGGAISRVAGGPLEEPIDTRAAPRAEGLDPKRVEMWQRLIESRDYAVETGMGDIGDSIECLARWALDDIAAAGGKNR